MMTRRPFSLIWLLILMTLSATASRVYSQESQAAAPPVSAAPTTPQVGDSQAVALRQQRDALANEAKRMKSEGKFVEAAVIGEKTLAVERSWLGESDRQIITSIEWLAGTYLAAEDLPNYRQKLDEALRWRIAQLGEEHWETKVSRQKQLEIQPLSLQQFGRMLEADRLGSEVDRLRREGKLVEAIAVTERICDLRRDILGEKSLPYANSLNNLGFLYMSMKDYARAEMNYLRAIEIRNQVLGESNPYFVNFINNLGLMYASMGEYARAEPLYLQALQIKKILGEANPSYAASLMQVGALYLSMKEYARAKPYYLQALEIRRNALGDRHPDYAQSLFSLGYAHWLMKEYARAELYYLPAMEIRKSVLGEQHPDYARSIYELGVLYFSMKDFARAEPFLRQYMEIRKKILGEAHPEYVRSLHDIGLQYFTVRDYARAEPFLLQANEIRRKVQGEEHPDYAASLTELGVLYSSMKDFARAEPYLRKALEIRKKVLGETHSDYAVSLGQLGVLYSSMRDFARAEPLCLQAREMLSKAVGEEDLRMLACLNNLGSLYAFMGDYARAEPYFRQEIELRKKLLGEKDPDYVISLANLGAIYAATKDYARAEQYSLEAMEIRKKDRGQEHPDYALSLNNLGTLYASMGDWVRADPFFRQAVEIYTKNLNKDHIDLAVAHNNLGRNLIMLKRMPEAESELEHSARIGLTHLQKTFAIQTERQKLILLERVRLFLDGWLSVAPSVAVAPEAMYDRLLLWKGIVFVEQQRQQLLRTDPELAVAFSELESLTRQLAATSFSVSTSEAERQDREMHVQTLTEQKEQIERQLAQQSAAYRQQQRTIQTTSRDLLSNLPENAALIDFIVYTNSTRAGDDEKTLLDELRLLAFVIRSNRSIARIDMGPIGPIDMLIEEWRKQVRYPVGLLGEDHPGIALRKLLWAPLEASLVGAETILISPDGPLCRFPFAALPGHKPDTFLIEEQSVAVIPVPQLLPQLLASAATKEASVAGNEAMLLVGAVDYGASPGPSVEDRGSETEVSLLELERSAALPTYGPLTQTREEIDVLQRSFKEQFPNHSVTLLDGKQATEAAFRGQASDCRWLHLATHGFFAPAQLRSALSSEIKERSLVPGEFERKKVSGFNPGLLSGIVLTGANTKPAEGEDDGILTALEVAALDLSQVDLAVLSACETGLGKAAGGEGVLGLQRAFQLAGARTVVSSLWRVPDRQTSLLMQRFYHNVWQKKLSTVEALREAQIWTLRGADEFEAAEVSPSQWAAFVLSGDWRMTLID